MIRGLRHGLGLGRRSRRSLVFVGWLCFMVAAVPCVASTAAACCPVDGAKDHAEAHDFLSHSPAPEPVAGIHAVPGGHETHGDHDTAPPAKGTTDGCHTQLADECCENPTPTLEDRTPKPLAKVLDLVASSTEPARLTVATGQRTRIHPTTGPPGTDIGPRRHCVLCTWLN